MSEPDPSDIARLIRELTDATELLERVVDDRGLIAHLDEDARTRFLIAAGRVAQPDSRARRALRRTRDRQRKRTEREADENALDALTIRRARAQPVFAIPSIEAPRDFADDGPRLHKPRGCYICKTKITELHHFYDSMCRPCGDLNLERRNQTADLRGRTALLTGGRVKIGYQAGLKLLRAGCRLVVTTRFPRDAASRYAAEPDFGEWVDRLVVHGVDLRHTPSVESLCRTILDTELRLDFIVNNACQTVRRPPGFYRHLMDAERQSIAGNPVRALVHGPTVEAIATREISGSQSAELTQVPLMPEDFDHSVGLFPHGALDADLQQVDLREVNSWRLHLDEVPTVELLEVHLVNAVAPFVINARLKPLMIRSGARDLHIVNVSAVEGQFYRTFKTARHPHTNMAKAALNMLTRTSAPDYVRDGIHMNSVDTGWVTDEDPAALAEIKRKEQRFHPPLDIVDGAARIVDPVFRGIATGEHIWGRFLKDYVPTDW